MTLQQHILGTSVLFLLTRMRTWVIAVDENGYTLRLSWELPVYLVCEEGCVFDSYYEWPSRGATSGGVSIWCVWFPTLSCGFFSLSVRKDQVGLLIVSVISLFLPPFISQSSYKTIRTTYIVEPKILPYSDAHKADTLGRDWYIRLRDANHTSPKQHTKKVDCLSAEDYEPGFSVCLKILHIMPWLSNLRPSVVTNRAVAQRRGFSPRAVHVAWIFD